MRIPPAPANWSPQYQQSVNSEVEMADRKNRKVGQDVELGPGDGTRQERLILRSPDGTRWSIEVDNAGVISATAL